MRRAIVILLWVEMLNACFGAELPLSRFIYPSSDFAKVKLGLPFQWIPDFQAQGYRLQIGTAQGKNDIEESGEINAVTYPMLRSLRRTPTWARLSEKIGGVWTVAQDIQFGFVLPEAEFLFPTNSTQEVSQPILFSWNTPSDAQGYILRVGATKGGSEYAESGVIQSHAFKVSGLPAGVTIWARLYTELNEGWNNYSEISFTAGPAPTVVSEILFPLEGTEVPNQATPFSWAALPEAEAYSLWVGTAPQTQDVLTSGEIQITSFPMYSLPGEVPLWATVWTKLDGQWHASPSVEFTVAPGPKPSSFLFPTNGTVRIQLGTSFSWSPGTLADRYYLYVGSTKGAKDIVDSGETLKTEWPCDNIPFDMPLWATLYGHINGGWFIEDQKLFTATLGAGFVRSSVADPTNVDPSKPLSWLPVENASSYRLKVGSAPGLDDLFSGETGSDTSVTIPSLPTGINLSAELQVLIDGVWSTAWAEGLTVGPYFQHPRIGEFNVNSALPFRWTQGVPFVGKTRVSYRLTLGTAPDRTDIFDSGLLQTNECVVPDLPLATNLYARAWIFSGAPVPAINYSVFSTIEPKAPQLIYPEEGQSDVATAATFRWAQDDLAAAYRLRLFRAELQIVDSGPIEVPRYLARGLSPGAYRGELTSQVDGQWRTNSFQFAVSAMGDDWGESLASAFWATGWVRNRADELNHPYPWTHLRQIVPANRGSALCPEFRDALLFTLNEMNFNSIVSPLYKPRILAVAFGAIGYDTHTLVEAFNGRNQRWMLLDPTFGITVSNKLTGTFAQFEDVQKATIAHDWSALAFIPLSDKGTFFLDTYYLDYPLLYLNLYQRGDVFNKLAQTQPLSIQPYLDLLPSYPVSTPGIYLVKSSALPVAALVGGAAKVFEANTPDGFGYGFPASTVLPIPGSSASISVFKPRRDVFPFLQSTYVSPATSGENLGANDFIAWDPLSGVTGYQLSIGTERASGNLVSSEVFHDPRFQLPSLPHGVPLWARLSTQVRNNWLVNVEDIQFSVSDTAGDSFLAPDGTGDYFDQTFPFRWASKTAPDAYRVYVGELPSGNELFDSGEILTTSCPVAGLPGGAQLWASLWAERAGVWSNEQNVPFIAQPDPVEFVTPLDGGSDVDPVISFEWGADPAAQAYRLTVGSVRGGDDLLDSGELVESNYPALTLPSGAALWARLWVQRAGSWLVAQDIHFTTAIVIPKLEVLKRDGQIILSWPVAEPEFLLETIGEWSPEPSWEPVVDGIKTQQDRHFFTPDSPNASALYRLRRP